MEMDGNGGNGNGMEWKTCFFAHTVSRQTEQKSIDSLTARSQHCKGELQSVRLTKSKNGSTSSTIGKHQGFIVTVQEEGEELSLIRNSYV